MTAPGVGFAPLKFPLGARMRVEPEPRQNTFRFFAGYPRLARSVGSLCETIHEFPTSGLLSEAKTDGP